MSTPRYFMTKSERLEMGAEWFLRVALAASFLSAVADRFGLWGPPGTAAVAWGSWDVFVDYVGVLNWFLPPSAYGTLACIATAAEIVIALGLLIGWRLRWFALASSLLLMIFALTMVSAFGVKPPLDYSVLTASTASLILAIGRDAPDSAS